MMSGAYGGMGGGAAATPRGASPAAPAGGDLSGLIQAYVAQTQAAAAS